MRAKLRIAGVLVALGVVLAVPAHIVAAPTWVEIRAPFSGTWNKANAAPPATHDPGIWGGDWATDFYQLPGNSGEWYAYSSSGSTVTAVVTQHDNTCPADAGGQWNYAGYKYKIEVSNDSGDLGWFEYAHVDPDNGTYFLGLGVHLSNGMHIGKTRNWGNRPDCYVVYNDDGVHWHIVGYNNSAYSCYDPWPANSWVSRQSGLLGVVGSNATGPGMSCW